MLTVGRPFRAVTLFGINDGPEGPSYERGRRCRALKSAVATKNRDPLDNGIQRASSYKH